MVYNSSNKLRVFTAFSGYDSQCLALNLLKQSFKEFDYELVGWSEIDKAAIIAHNALFPEAEQLNFGDITEIMYQKTLPLLFLLLSFFNISLAFRRLLKSRRLQEGVMT